MMPTSQEHTILLRLIKVGEDRQRKNLDYRSQEIAFLAASIRAHGQLNPIVITEDYQLVAGERRYAALIYNAADDQDMDATVRVRFMSDLDPLERHAVELEENIQRSDLTWVEQAEAIAKYHQFKVQQNSDWSQEDTATALHIPRASVTKSVVVSKEMERDEKIQNAGGLNAAYNMVTKRHERMIDTELAQLDILGAALGPVAPVSPAPAVDPGFLDMAPPATGAPLIDIDLEAPATENAQKAPFSIITSQPAVLDAPAWGFSRSAEDCIINQSFLEWAPKYDGKRFNFLHCDFPYGVDIGNSDQMKTKSGLKDSYEDQEEVYWALCNALRDNFDRVLFPSAHIMFWFSMKFYEETLAFFREIPRLVVQDFPLVWLKTDGKGVVPDAERQPRRIYETALIMSYGDRKIVKAVANGYGAPTGKQDALHLSEKPEPVLRHFMRLFVDDLSEVLDPTCGAGSALRAAESLGAKRVAGMDINPEYVAVAQAELKKARKLADLAKVEL